MITASKELAIVGAAIALYFGVLGVKAGLIVALTILSAIIG